MNKSATHAATPDRPGEPKTAGRLTLNADEVAALGEAYRLLDRIHARHHARMDRQIDGEGSSDD